LVYALFLSKNIKLDFKKMIHPGKMMIADFFRYASPVVVNESLWGLGFSMFSVVFAHMATHAAAAYTVVNQVERVLSIFNFGIAVAASVIIGKVAGTGQFKKVYQYGRALIIMTAAQGVVVGILMFFAAPVVLSLMQTSSESKELAYVMFIVVAAIMGLRSFNCTNIVGVLRGGGDVRFAMMCDVGALWLAGLPVAFILGLVLRLPPQFVMIAFVVDEVIKGVTGMTRFMSRKWINNLTREYV